MGTRCKTNRTLGVCLVLLLLSACAFPPPKPRAPSPGHIGTVKVPEPEIPAPVQQTPFLPAPKPAPPLETYTVVVHEVPVKELLFALARDAALNVDIHPDIEGSVTLNAVDQTLPQILDRISRQIELRYEFTEASLLIEPDLPFFKFYKIDYVNIARETTGSTSVTTQVETGGGEGGVKGTTGSQTALNNTSKHDFWGALTRSLTDIVTAAGDPEASGSVVANPESGVVVVRATARQHERVQQYIDQVLVNAKRQVLIEATLVEVELNDRYQGGIDWGRLATGAGITVAQSVLGGFDGVPALLFEYANSRDPETPGGTPDGELEVIVQLLKEFGNIRVLSSPRMMVLNNQTALLKSVDEVVYFEIEEEVVAGNINTDSTVATNSKIKTVSVGLTLSLTPQISDADTITVNIRPTISRIARFVPDPVNEKNEVPEITTRELESLLQINSGQIAVLGGLMQDTVKENTDGIPVLSDIETRDIGEYFKYRDNDYAKTELVVFLRPWVIRDPNVETDLWAYRRYLPENLREAQPVKSPGMSIIEGPQ